MPFIGTQPEVGGYSVLDALTASATASYTLQKDSANFSPSSANQLLVSLNGVIQKPGSSFTVSGSTLTFSSALSSSDSIDFILAMGEPLLIGTPSDGTVTRTKTSFIDSDTGSLTLPAGTTAQRTGSAANGMIRYNTTLNVTEEYRDGGWHNLSNLVTTSGGTVTNAGGYTIHTFTSSGTFQVVGGNKAGVDYMVLAGGGGGGSTRAGGGGAGGMVVTTNQTLAAGSYTVTIGAGGAGNTGTSGEGSTGGNTSFGSLQTCNGGGYGGGEGVAGQAGGSGGGGSDGQNGGAGTSGQGNAGGNSTASSGGGGGGGKGGAGETGGTDGAQQGGDGGAALANAYSGSSVDYAGGGGGGSRDGGAAGTGGGGAGNGGINASNLSTAAAANRGGGGGGGGRDSGSNDDGSNGGSGVVIIRYLT